MTARVLTALVLSSAVVSAYDYERRYVAGETDTYEILLAPVGVDSELVAVTQHRTAVAGGVGRERVRFLRASESLAGDLSERFDGASLTLSLDARARAFSSWTGADPVAAQVVDALQMFYIAQHPGAAETTVFEEDWSQRANTLAGFRRSTVEVELAAEEAKTATYDIRFAPSSQALTLPKPWMSATACPDGAVTFYSVVAEDADYRVSWGCEHTSIRSEVAKDSGKILRATMATRVYYRERFCSDEGLTECSEIKGGTNEHRARLLLRRTDPPIPPDRLMTNARDGLDYVKIPAGSFTMGCVEGDPDCYPRETPRHRVTITKEFWMGRTEVPVGAFEAFLDATGGSMPAEPGSGAMPGYNDGWRKKDHPMVKVTWDEAQSYCQWAGGRLPTEAEWEYAARGGLAGTRYPWGGERSHDMANYWRSGGFDRWKYTAPVASFPANGFGLFDMAGNVYEWTADWYDLHYYDRSPEVDPPGPSSGRRRVARGGGGFINSKVLRVSARLSADPGIRNVGLGLRCVLPASSN